MTRVLNFPTLARISETAGGVSDVLKNEAIIHLNRLLDEFQHYFPDFKSDNPMMEFTRDPFSFRVDNFPKEAEDIEEQFVDLVRDSAAKAVFAEISIAFWATMVRILALLWRRSHYWLHFPPHTCASRRFREWL